MKWHILDTNSNSGNFNMEYDLMLADKCSENEAYLRFYQWDPPCISIGVHQSFDDLNLNKIKFDGLDMVKRPTGGRAILHSEELTYSVVIPASTNLTGEEIYNKISLSLVKGLQLFDPKLMKLELEEIQPDFKSRYQSSSGIICFTSTAKHEVKYNGKKLVGSAQRKFSNSILQHGSILIGKSHAKLVDYLNLDFSELERLKTEITGKTIELETILNYSIDLKKIISSIVLGFEQVWGNNFKAVKAI